MYIISAISSAVMDLLYVSILKEPIESICKGEVKLLRQYFSNSGAGGAVKCQGGRV